MFQEMVCRSLQTNQRILICSFFKKLIIYRKYFTYSKQYDKFTNNKKLNKSFLSFNKTYKGTYKKRTISLDADYVKDTLNKIRQIEMMNNQEPLQGTSYKITGRQLKVMSYNVLAQDLVESYRELYRNHNPNWLKWEHRSALLMSEITSFLPDILSLQEVQESHIASFYNELEELGYRSIYRRRFGNKTDGCALYYMSSLMDLVEYRAVNFNLPEINPILDNRPNVGIVARLRPKTNGARVLGRDIIVANTHLLFNPRRTDVRLLQIQILLAEIQKITEKMSDEEPAVLLMGDLNSLPNSSVVRLLMEGRLPWNLMPTAQGLSDRCTYLETNDRTRCRFNERNRGFCDGSDRPADKYKNDVQHSPSDVTHRFQFASVYDWENQYGEPLATTYQGRWIIVDYMFYTKNIKLTARLKLPTVDECTTKLSWIPNKASPSDHYPLAATFIVE